MSLDKICLPVFTFIFISWSISGCTVAKPVGNFPNDISDPDNTLTTWAAAWSPDGHLIATGGTDSIVRLYKASSLKLLHTFRMDSWVHRLSFHPHKELLAVATLDDYVQLIDLKTGLKRSLADHGSTRTVAWNADGSLLGVADHDSELKIWGEDGNLVASVKKTFADTTRSSKSFLGMDWHPSENLIVVVSDDVTLYDVHGNELMAMDHPNPAAILCVDWHPSGRIFVTGDYGHNWDGENIPSLLHIVSRDGDFQTSISGSKAEYRNIAWNPAGTRLATASDQLRIWDAQGHLLYESGDDGKNYLWGLAWHPNGKRIVTSSRFGDIALWDMQARMIKKIREK